MLPLNILSKCPDAVKLHFLGFVAVVTTMSLACGRTSQQPSDSASSSSTGPTETCEDPSATAADLVFASASACLLLSDGSGQCWGDNTYGELGIGVPFGSSTPRRVENLCGAMQIALSGVRACAAMNDGSVRCWGDGFAGETGPLGTGTDLSPIEVPGVDNVVEVSVAGPSGAVDVDGHVWLWGFQTPGGATPTMVEGAEGVEELFLFGSLRCGRRPADWICWGTHDGWAGESIPSYLETPTVIDALSEVAWMGIGFNHTCWLMKDGRVMCWGENGLGALGDGTHESKKEPTPVLGIDSAVQLSIAGLHSCALLADKTVRCWGHGADGQLGNGDLDSRNVPTPVEGLVGATDIAAGSFASCALAGEHELYCWGTYVPGATEIETLPVKVTWE